MAGHDSSTKAILYAFSANLGIAIAKGIAAAMTGSSSMLAESIHSAADCANQLLLFLGLKRSQRPPSPNHPLGYGKVIYFWSFIVAILLFSVGGLFSIFSGVRKIIEPPKAELEDVGIAIVILIVSIALEGFSLMGALKEIKKIRQDKTFRQWLKTTRNAELIVILGEDIAALIGLCLALIFVSLAHLTGIILFDFIGSISIGAILVIVSIFLTIRVKSLLIGKSAGPDIEKCIEELISNNENVDHIFNIITMQFGPQIMLAAKIKIKSGISIDTGCEIINNVEKSIKSKFPEIKWSFIEPDIYD